MKTPTILLVIFCVIGVYANTLLNSYVGQGRPILLDTLRQSVQQPSEKTSPFLADITNRLFSKPTTIEQYQLPKSILYRLDQTLANNSPWITHLINLIIHAVTAVSVFFLIYHFQPRLALMTALCFALHPIQTEVVSTTAYRSVSLSFLLIIVSFLSWLRFQRGGNIRFFFGSLFSYALGGALTEIALMFPFVILAYQTFFSHKVLESLKHIELYLAGFFVTMAAGIVCYVFFSPAYLFSNALFLNGSLVYHVLTVLSIVFENFWAWINPLATTSFPDGYYPDSNAIVGLKPWLGLMAGFLGIYALVQTYRRCRMVSFFLLWAFIFYLPIANIIPLEIPMANRLMYFPTLGLSLVLAYGLDQWILWLTTKKSLDHPEFIIKVSMVALLAVMTLTLNGFWKSPYAVGSTWIRNYPNFHQGYTVLGYEHYQAGLYREAKSYYKKSQELGNDDPTIDYALGRSEMATHDLPKAYDFWTKAIAKRPDYAQPYYGLGQYYVTLNMPTRAIRYFQKATTLQPEVWQYYHGLIEAFMDLNRWQEAQYALKQAKQFLKREDEFDFLEKVYQHRIEQPELTYQKVLKSLLFIKWLTPHTNYPVRMFMPEIFSYEYSVEFIS